MKANIAAHKMQKSLENNLVLEQVLKPDIVVLSGVREIDELLGGFKAGEITFIDGDSELIAVMPNHLCVNTYRTFGNDTIYIDGGMCADPYKIARYARRMEVDQKKALEHIHISRAFTVYQLTTLVQDMLELVIKRYDPRTLIIGRFPALYLDSDVKNQEAQTLLKSNLEKINDLTSRYDLITVFTNFDKKMVSNKRNVRNILYSNVSEIVRLKQREMSINVDLLKKKQNATILTLAQGQLRLQDFGMVI